MKIKLNETWIPFDSFLPSTSRIMKPIVYLISSLALGIILYSCYRYLNSCRRSWCMKRDLKKEDGDIQIGIQTPSNDLSSSKPSNLSFEQLLKNSQNFASHTPFPTQNNLIQNFATTEQLRKEVLTHAITTCPIIPAHIWSFFPKFLDFKKEHGSEIEKQLYRDMTTTQFLDRLLKKRPLMFMTHKDSYLLRNGQKGAGGFDQIGTDQEQKDLCLKDYQSYFEMSLAAFVSLFAPSHFINVGGRFNKGCKDIPGTYESKGIVVGMVGARFERPGLMEYAHMVVTPQQNTAATGYGALADPQNPKTIELRLWAELYQQKIGEVYAFPDYEEAKKDQTGRYIPTKGGLLDTVIYKERLRLIIESFLLESNDRAKQQGQKAYLHIVGLGLGVWMINPKQTDLMLEVYADVLQKHKFDHISDVNFSWFNGTHTCGGISNQEIFNSQGHSIKIHFSKRDPAEKLKGEDEGKLLIAQYAWDANSYPGNEYWISALTASGDPAAACCSTIPELQNPEINPFVQALSLKVISA
jgi:hypothetical protein